MEDRVFSTIGLKKRIVDPFSLNTKPRKLHATRAYSLAMLQQLDEQRPELAEEVRVDILDCIDDDHREGFFETLEKKAHLYVCGATNEAVFRTVSRHIDLDDRLTVLQSMESHSPFKKKSLITIGNTLGIEFIIKQITKATSNVTHGVVIRRLARSSAERDETTGLVPARLLSHILDIQAPPDRRRYEESPVYFQYTSTPPYMQHMNDHFPEEEFDNIEQRNFMFTTEFFKLIPRLCLGDRSPEGFLAAHAKHKDAYFFAMYFPKRMLWKRIVRTFSRKNKTVDHTMKSIKNDAHTEWDEYKNMVTGRVREYSLLHDLVEKELCLAIERFRDIGSVDPFLYAKVSRKVEQFEADIDKLRNLRPQWLETSLSLELAEPSDLLDLGETLSEPYAEGAALEQRLEESWRKLNGYEQRAVDILVEGYQHAEDKVQFIKEFLDVLAEKDTWINHPYRVSDLAGELCRRANDLGITEIDPETAMRSGLLHDWGKLLVPRSILEKPGKLDDWEFDVIMKHPTHGMQILQGIGFTQEALASGYHHEFYDGSRGYPKEKKGAVIPEIARLVAYADVLDAIAAASLDRGYDKARQGRIRNWKDAVEEIHRCSGTQLDPLFLPAFDAMVEDGFVKGFYADRTGPYKSQRLEIPAELL